jgi:hypothetical protein
MKVTDGCDSSGSNNNGSSRKKLVEQRKAPGIDHRSTVGEVTTANLNGNGGLSEDTSSSGSEDSETLECSLNNESSSSPHSGINGGLADDSSQGRNGSSDKENSKPLITTKDKTSSKKNKANGSSKASKNSRNSEERNGLKSTSTTSSANDTSAETEDDSTKENDGTEESPNGDEKQDPADDVLYVHDTGLTIKIVSPGSEPFEIQVFFRSPCSVLSYVTYMTYIYIKPVSFEICTRM